MGFLYFAYGSNMLSQRLLCKQRTKEPVRIGVGKLENFELRFKGFDNQVWKGYPSTIEECAGSDVWGVVWDIDEADRSALDSQENTHEGIMVKVTLESGETVECLVYKMLGRYNVDASGKPSPQYLDIIKRGATQNGLPQAYIDFLYKVEHNNFSGVVDVYDQVMKELTD